MKKFKIYMISLCFIPLIISCDKDILNTEDADSVPLSEIGGIDAFNAYMFQVYEFSRSVHENMEISLYKQCGTDLVRSGTNLTDVAAGGMLGMNQYDSGLAASSGEINNLWNGYYFALDRCNLVLQGAENFDGDQELLPTINRFKGDALVMRAFINLELVQRFDNITVSRLLPDGEEPSLEAPLVDKEVIYAQIIADCQEALPLLATRAETGSVGSPSKGLANLVLAKTYMDLGNWADAAAAADAVVNDGSYSLQPLNNIFGLSGGKTGEENNNEIILSWVFNPVIQNRAQRTSQMFVPLYDRIDGVVRSMASGGRPWARLTPSNYYWSIWEDGDGRLEAWHKLNWLFDDPDNLPPGAELGDIVTEADVIAQFGADAIQTRYIEPTTTKHWEDGTYGRTVGEAEGFRNIIVHRYSEAFILGAEAHWRNGNNARALELINTLRERAFGDSNHNITVLNEDVILDEHARELGHEGHRWAMLKRLGILIDRVRANNPNAEPNIQAKHTRWPIPQSFVDLAGVEQNTGY